jgi:surface polysaccharide O-acyltransferase-like enzyme
VEEIMDNDVKEMPKIRFAYLDNLRSLVIIFVITIHSAVTYSGFGGWYYVEGSPENLSIFGTVFFGLLQSFLQAWTMGILFFISAYLATKSLAKRGSFGFIKERLFRLGLPLFLFVFVISPVISFILLGYYSENSFLENYIQFLWSFSWLGATGPLWFVQVLLIFCIIYTVLKKNSNGIKIQQIGLKNIIFTILLTAIIAFLARLVFPVGSSFLNLQFSYFSSYIIMFIAGILIGENNLLGKITDEKNIKWLKITLIIGTPLWFIIMLFGGALKGHRYFDGGFYWQSFAFALWESLTAIGFSIGLITFFKKKVNVENRFTVLMRDNAFGIYFFHAPILVIVSLFFRQFVLYPILKFVVVLIITSIVCLLFSFLIRKIKLIGIIFK